MSEQNTLLDELVHFIQARELARFCRENDMTPPHYADPIIAAYHFCNVNREDDRVTKVVKTHVRDKIQGKGDLVLNIAIARIFNEPRTIERVIPFVSCAKIRLTVAQLRKEDPKGRIFRGAYLAFPVGVKNTGVSQLDYWLARFDALHKYRKTFDKCSTLWSVADALWSLPGKGFGPFFRNQICTDLRYTEPFANAEDWETYLEAGPGTIRGIRRYFHAHPFGPNKIPLGRVPEFVKLVQSELLTQSDTGTDLTCFRDPNNVSNLFCEFDKYLRVKSGQPVGLRRYRQS